MPGTATATATIRQALRMDDESGDVFLDVSRYVDNETDGTGWEAPEGDFIGNIRDIESIVPELAEQLEALRDRWEAGRDRRDEEREESRREWLGLRGELWWGA